MPKQEERGFKYKKRTKDDLKERANMKGGNYDTYIKPKYKQWKPKDGKNLIRILPPTWDNAKHYGLDIFVNFNIGADNQSYLSLSKHGKGQDPLADARREAQADGDKDLAKALNPSQRILYWIIDRMDEDEGPLLWAAPFTFDKSLSNLCIDEDTKDVLFIDDPETGRDVRFYKEGTGLTTKYDPSKMKVLKDSPLHDDEGLQDDWLAFITEAPLPDVLNFYTAEHINATFNGQAGRKDDDEDEKPISRRSRSSDDDDADEKPARKRAAKTEEADEPPARRKRAAAEEDEVEEKPARRSRAPADDDEDDPKPARRRAAAAEDEDDEPPVRSRARSKASEPEDEDDESPPPKSRRGKTDDEDEGGGSIRERLARRRSRSSDDD